MLNPETGARRDVPFATVIVRTKNSQDTIAKALDGLFAQSF
jgi:hypothetical protein